MYFGLCNSSRFGPQMFFFVFLKIEYKNSKNIVRTAENTKNSYKVVTRVLVQFVDVKNRYAFAVLDMPSFWICTFPSLTKLSG